MALEAAKSLVTELARCSTTSRSCTTNTSDTTESTDTWTASRTHGESTSEPEQSGNLHQYVDGRRTFLFGECTPLDKSEEVVITSQLKTDCRDD